MVGAMNFLNMMQSSGRGYGRGAGRMMRPRFITSVPNLCATPGRKVRSGGMGRGLARGRGMGPRGIPFGNKMRGNW